MRHVLNRCVRWLFLSDNSSRRRSNTCGYLCRLVFVLASLGVVALLIVGIKAFHQDVHILFWLGRLPQVTLVFTLSATVILLVGLCYAKYVFLYRQFELENRRMRGGKEGWCARNCHCSLRTIRLMLFVIGLLAICGIVFGQEVLRFGLATASALMSSQDCDTRSPAKEIEVEQKKLDSFAGKCRQQSPSSREKSVVACPGFSTKFTAPAPYSTYIQTLERDFSCAGFCTAERKPLFGVGGDAAAAPTAPGGKWAACAPALGRHIWRAALGVGCAALGIGAVLIIFAAMLYAYDEL